MIIKLPFRSVNIKKTFVKASAIKPNGLTKKEKLYGIFTILMSILLSVFFFTSQHEGIKTFISPLLAAGNTVEPLHKTTKQYEVLGFAPYWTFNKLDNVDFSVLTTFAYFGVPVLANGDLDRSDQGYLTFESDKATEIFTKAHNAGTRVILTVTQMDNDTIEAFLDDPSAQENAISQIIAEVKGRGLDGINIDFEYSGDPGSSYRDAFSQFVNNLSWNVHQQIPQSTVSISVYASSVRKPQLYDIASLSQNTDMVFMMAYDFAVAGSDTAMPTDPLYGKKEGKYYYDVSTAVDDFLKYMPAEKLVLGVPYYGYNYPVYSPGVNVDTRPYWDWKGVGQAQTYTAALTNDTVEKEGWDDVGKVGWKAYYVPESGTWRMIFLDDAKSLGIKYDFAKSKNLKGIGMWALGFDDGRPELWNLLREKFGTKLASATTLARYN